MDRHNRDPVLSLLMATLAFLARRFIYPFPLLHVAICRSSALLCTNTAEPRLIQWAKKRSNAKHIHWNLSQLALLVCCMARSIEVTRVGAAKMPCAAGCHWILNTFRVLSSLSGSCKLLVQFQDKFETQSIPRHLFQHAPFLHPYPYHLRGPGFEFCGWLHQGLRAWWYTHEMSDKWCV
jgi:hypothetical protein